MFYAQSPGPGGLARQGPLIAVILRGPVGSVQTYAQVDTGSSMSSADASLLRQVGASPGPQEQVQTVSPFPLTVRQACGVEILDPNGAVLDSGPLLAVNLPAPVQVLIGRDVLAGMDFGYEGPAGTWQLGSGRMEPVAFGLPLWMIVGSAYLAGLGLGLAIGSYFERRMR